MIPVPSQRLDTTVADGTNPTINLPAANVGDLYFGVMTYYHSNNYDPTLPAGWSIHTDAYNSGGLVVFSRPVDGSEGATVQFQNMSGVVAASVFTITGYDDQSSPFIEVTEPAYQAGSSSIGELDAPSITASWGNGDNLFFTMGISTRNPTSWNSVPAGYTGNEVLSPTNVDGWGTLLYVGHKGAVSATDDPGLYVDGTFKQYTAVTAVIKGVSTSPQIAITSGDIVPGQVVSGTYSNMPNGLASPLTLTQNYTDLQGNPQVRGPDALAISASAPDQDGNGTWSATYPLPENQGMLYLDTITITGNEAP